MHDDVCVEKDYESEYDVANAQSEKLSARVELADVPANHNQNITDTDLPESSKASGLAPVPITFSAGNEQAKEDAPRSDPEEQPFTSRQAEEEPVVIHSGPRDLLFVTEDRLWTAITGHNMDPKAMQPNQFDLLMLIASAGKSGMSHGLLRDITSQDIRSIPGRTDDLAAKGYILKTTVTVKNRATTTCIHRRYAEMKSMAASAPNPKTSESAAGVNASDQLNILTTPTWDPKTPWSNKLFAVANAAGPDGISTMELGCKAAGPLWRRPAEQRLQHLSDAWLVSQPHHLRHLAIVRDTAMENKAVHYLYRSFGNFEKAILSGRASWEALGPSFVEALGRPNPENASSLDKWGFPIPSGNLVDGGYASVQDAYRAVRTADAGSSIKRKYTLKKTNNQHLPASERAHDIETVPEIRTTGVTRPIARKAPVSHGSGVANEEEVDATTSLDRARKKRRTNTYIQSDDVLCTNEASNDVHTHAESTGLANSHTAETVPEGADSGVHADVARVSIRKRERPRRARGIDPLPLSAQQIASPPIELESQNREEQHLSRDMLGPGLYIHPSWAVPPTNPATRGRPRKRLIVVVKTEKVKEYDWFQVDSTEQPESSGMIHSQEDTDKMQRPQDANVSPIPPQAQLPDTHPLSQPNVVTSTSSDRQGGDASITENQPGSNLTMPLAPPLTPKSKQSTRGTFGKTVTPKFSVAARNRKARRERTDLNKYKVSIGSGHLVYQRSQLVLEILREAGGAYPCDGEMWYAVLTKTKKLGWSANPDRLTVTNTVSNLELMGAIRKIKFGFKYAGDKEYESTYYKHIAILENMEQDDPKAVELQRRIIESYPTLYFPPEIEIDPTIRADARGKPQTHKYSARATAKRIAQNRREREGLTQARKRRKATELSAPDFGIEEEDNTWMADAENQYPGLNSMVSTFSVQPTQITEGMQPLSYVMNEDQMRLRDVFTKGVRINLEPQSLPALPPVPAPDLVRKPNQMKDCLSWILGHTGNHKSNVTRSHRIVGRRTEASTITDPDQIFHALSGTFSTEFRVIRRARPVLSIRPELQSEIDKMFPQSLDDIMNDPKLQARIPKHTRRRFPADAMEAEIEMVAAMGGG